MSQSTTLLLSDYSSAFWRRLPLFFYVAVPILLIAVGFATGLPDVYRSSAEMQINLEGPGLDTVEPLALTSFADQYVSTLRRNALSRDNMLRWLREFNLYSYDNDKTEESELLKRMADHVRIDLVKTSVLRPDGRSLELVTGFTVGFDDADPQIAQRLAASMTAAFQQEDRRIGAERTDPVLSFLEQQMDERREEISRLESQLAEFKEKNRGRLPELMALNMSVLDRSERELDAVKQEIDNLEQNRIYRQAQLDEILETSASASQLAELEQEYVEKSAKYGSDHPDLIRIKRQIEALTEGGSISGETAEIARLQGELATLRQRYSDQYPDVIALRRQIETLRNEQQETIARVRKGPQGDPRYLELRAQVDAIDTKLQGLRERESELRKKIGEIEGKIADTPQVERKYLALERDLNGARESYNDLREKWTETKQTAAMERSDLGARLQLLSEPYVPDEPASPPRLIIIVLGLFLSLTFGCGTAIAAEILDPTVRGSRDVQTILHAKPIVAIPVVQNSVVRAAKRRHYAIVAGSIVILVAIVFSVSGLTRLVSVL